MSQPTPDANRRRLLQSSLALATSLIIPIGMAKPSTKTIRSITFCNLHTGENLIAPYWRDGRYDPTVLSRIDHLLRDHRTGESIAMAPKLIDLLHRLNTELGRSEAVQVISGYRSPKTNDALRRKSSGVAKRSLHMLGQAIDIRRANTPTAELYEAALSLGGGGVGLYTKSDFVHLDVGRVRTWGS